MPEHLPSQMIELFIARKLAPADLLTVAQHLAVCDICRTQSNQLKNTSSGILYLRSNLQEEFTEHSHLSYEQLAAFVDSSLNQAERETAAVHIAACAACAKEVQELELLKSSLVTYPNLAVNKEDSFAASQASDVAGELRIIVKPKPPEPSATIWQNLAAFFRGVLPQSAFAIAAALLVVAVIIGFLVRNSTNQPQIAQSPESGTKPATTVSNPPDGAAPPSISQANKNTAPPQLAQNNPSNTNVQSSPGNSPADAKTAGKRIEIPVNIGDGTSVATLPEGYETIIKQALTNQTIVRPAVIADLAGKPSNLMGKKNENESFALINPVGTVIQDETPTFRWQPLSGATTYTVYVLDLNFSVIAKSQPLSTTSWTMPQSLKRGGIYVWQVTATKNGKEITAPAAPRPEARFKILEQTKTNEMQRFARERADSHLILGTIYAHNGLLDEAEREFQMAIDQNQDADKAKKLLQSVKALR